MGMIAVGGLELGHRLSIPGFHGLIVSAEAVVGRPLTPGQRCWDGPAHIPAMRDRRLRMLANDRRARGRF